MKKLDKQLCLVETIDSLRDLEIFVKDNLIDKKTNFMLKYHDKKVIAFDGSI